MKSLRESGLPEDQVQEICDRISNHYVPWQESTFPGLLGNVVAGRIANRMNLGGTNCVIDAACASSLASVSMAMMELETGNSDLVITGGVDTLNDIFMYMCFSKTPALSPTGDCRPFSEQADGTMLGEGVGMVALKRLTDAERDGDRIYAVIKGMGSSSDGQSKSVYAPVAGGQAKALRRAYQLADYSPSTVELVEAHGTATKAGDLAEFEGLSTVYNESDRIRSLLNVGLQISFEVYNKVLKLQKCRPRNLVPPRTRKLHLHPPLRILWKDLTLLYLSWTGSIPFIFTDIAGYCFCTRPPSLCQTCSGRSV